eukprot:TRINITY_DN404_c0_g1_i2.p1 TRINITY_DN404_c0_g1~~TRINITY_DN404_c0_g1_i2.p1  ORF type:complete len:483 (+),score=122.03 TRINITY_DN404_c0_g1_i2:16-1464(+)
MGRSKGFKKDRMYITHKEWVEDWGGKKDDKEKGNYRTLQFYCCNLSLQPWLDPVCTKDGTIFDIVNIYPWLKKHKVDPVTGKPLKATDLIKLTFHKNASGEFHCPITYKIFTDYSHIVAIRTTGHVYAWEAIDKLCIKNKHWNDLVTGTAFTREDIITIQDPNDTEKNKIHKFYHINKGITKFDDVGKDGEKDKLKNITLTTTSEKIFKQIKEKEVTDKILKERKEEEELEAIKETNPFYTPEPKAIEAKPREYLVKESAAFTSSSFTPQAVIPTLWSAKKTNQKGYITVITNKGNINLQLHCDLVPITCENFITLCEKKYYNNTIFHRNIRHFMIQGGDPTGTGRGGTSIWGKEFPDEFHPTLKHEGSGILSMANRGRDTNTSQFFITYKSAPHLNNRHTVFGSVVGGQDVVKHLSTVQVDDDDKPLDEIKIIDTQVFLNPFSEEEMKKEKEEDNKKKRKEKEKVTIITELRTPPPPHHNL